jgi:hypothetical protein
VWKAQAVERDLIDPHSTLGALPFPCKASAVRWDYGYDS